MSNPHEWLQFHHHQQQYSPYGTKSMENMFDHVSDSTITTTTSAATTNFTSNNNRQMLNPEGRVSKPIRRRSRVSKRTPTTLFNTDASNFRAMVQKYTGGGGGGGGATVTNMNFNNNHHLHPIRPTPMAFPSGYNNIMNQQQSIVGLHNQMFASNNNMNEIGDRDFFYRPDMDIGVSSQALLSSSSSNNDNDDLIIKSNNHYMF